MKVQYLIRLDDACPTMNHEKWGRIENILDKYGVKPMVGIIPHNKDPEMQIDPEDKGFWNKVLAWEKKGWAIALHGYNHCYCSDKGLLGLNPMWKESEFVGLSVEQQGEKIRKGMAIMQEYGIKPVYFFAPSHTFDENTLEAIREESDIRIISDTIATGPYRHKDFVFIPQFSGSCREMKMKGLFTFCLHPNIMNDEAFDNTEQFIRLHRQSFISFDEINIENLGGKSLFDRMLSWVYFTQRKIRR